MLSFFYTLRHKVCIETPLRRLQTGTGLWHISETWTGVKGSPMGSMDHLHRDLIELFSTTPVWFTPFAFVTPLLASCFTLALARCLMLWSWFLVPLRDNATRNRGILGVCLCLLHLVSDLLGVSIHRGLVNMNVVLWSQSNHSHDTKQPDPHGAHVVKGIHK